MSDVDLSLLQKPFDPGQIGKLPRTTCRDCSNSNTKACSAHPKTQCAECGNYMTPRHIHLDYVGHAQVTARLLEVDPNWSWEPCGWTTEGTPAVRFEQGGRAVLWIKLTVGGVTRLGVGIVGSGKAECEKELIGDALRNAAMRFGVALDLWAKGDLHGEDNEAPDPTDEWSVLGWKDQAEHDAAHQEVLAEASALPEAAKEKLRAWLTEKGWSKPHGRQRLAEWMQKIEDLTPDDEDPGYDATPPKPEAAPPSDDIPLEERPE